MAAVHGPIIPGRMPSSPHRASSSKHVSSRAHPSMVSDPYYGHEVLAKTAAHFVGHLFTCPEYPPPVQGAPGVSIRLDLFIAYALHRTRLAESVTYAALYLLQRLKARFPAAKGSSGHRLFISAYMLGSKIICDDTYSNKSWCIVAQHMFQLREINQMEREMCSYLEWQLNVDPNTLREFQDRVKRDFAGPGPYPPLIFPQESTPEPASAPSSSIVSFPARLPPPASVTPFPSHPAHAAPSSALQLPSPPTSDEDETSSSPSTPGSLHSSTSSPASSLSPSTPPDSQPGYHVEVYGDVRAPSSYPPSSRTSRTEKARKRSPPASIAPTVVPPRRAVAVVATSDPYATVASEHGDVIVAPRGPRKRADSQQQQQRKQADSPSAARQKLQVGRDMYAYASRTVW